MLAITLWIWTLETPAAASGLNAHIHPRPTVHLLQRHSSSQDFSSDSTVLPAFERESSRSASGPLRPRYTQISRQALQHMPLQTPGHSEGFSCTQNSVVWGCFQLVFKVLIPLKTTTYWFNDSTAFGVRLIAVMTFHCLFVSLIWFKQQLQEFLSWFVAHFKEA